jgi:hypothetical protein
MAAPFWFSPPLRACPELAEGGRVREGGREDGRSLLISTHVEMKPTLIVGIAQDWGQGRYAEETSDVRISPMRLHTNNPTRLADELQWFATPHQSLLLPLWEKVQVEG